MFSQKIKTFFIAMTTFFLTTAMINAEEIVLDTTFFESEPLYFKDDKGDCTGICIDIMKKIEQTSNIRFNIKEEFVPRKRIAFWFLAGRYDVVLCVSKISIFEKLAQYEETPIFEQDFVALVRIDDPITLSSLDDIRTLGKEGRILAVSGSAPARVLEEFEGLDIDPGGKTANIVLRKLENKRGRFACLSALEASSELKKKENKNKFKILPISFKHVTSHALFSKLTSDNKEITAINQALSQLRENGEIDRIIDKYTDNSAKEIQMKRPLLH